MIAWAQSEVEVPRNILKWIPINGKVPHKLMYGDYDGLVINCSYGFLAGQKIPLKVIVFSGENSTEPSQIFIHLSV